MQLKFVTAMIAVLLLVVATSACINNNRNEGQTQAASSTPTNQNGANQPTVSVTATYLGSSNSLNSMYGTPTAAASGNKFVTYAVYCENINAKNMMMGNPYSLKLRDTQGNIYTYDTSSFNLQQTVNGKTLKGINDEMHTQPGDKVSGLIAFQIPASATPKSLTYDDYTNIITINL